MAIEVEPSLSDQAEIHGVSPCPVPAVASRHMTTHAVVAPCAQHLPPRHSYR
jgi:hypothetical protein